VSQIPELISRDAIFGEYLITVHAHNRQTDRQDYYSTIVHRTGKTKRVMKKTKNKNRNAKQIINLIITLK